MYRCTSGQQQHITYYPPDHPNAQAYCYPVAIFCFHSAPSPSPLASPGRSALPGPVDFRFIRAWLLVAAETAVTSPLSPLRNPLPPTASLRPKRNKQTCPLPRPESRLLRRRTVILPSLPFSIPALTKSRGCRQLRRDSSGNLEVPVLLGQQLHHSITCFGRPSTQLLHSNNPRPSTAPTLFKPAQHIERQSFVLHPHAAIACHRLPSPGTERASSATSPAFLAHSLGGLCMCSRNAPRTGATPCSVHVHLIPATPTPTPI